MVRAVIGDETQLKLAEVHPNDSAIPSQLPITEILFDLACWPVTGKLSSRLDRGFIYDLVPTPLNDAGEPPCSIIDGAGENNRNKKNAPKAKSQSESSTLFIDRVRACASGGMNVIGIYIRVTENLFKNSTVALCQTVRGVVEAASSIVECDDRQLVHISHSIALWGGHVENVRFHQILHRVVCGLVILKWVKFLVRSKHSDARTILKLPILHQDGLDIANFSDVLHDVIVGHAKELGQAKVLVLINGKLVTEDDQCGSGDFHEVEVLLPLLQDQYLEVCSQKEVLGVLHFRGSICSLSYLNMKEPISQALVDMKEDILRSLKSRLEILCDEGDSDLESTPYNDLDTSITKTSGKSASLSESNVQRKWCHLAFPRRVFVPWLEGTYIYDYIQSSETIEVLKGHCAELMSMGFPTDKSEILEPEHEAPVVLTSQSTTSGP